MRKFLAVVKHEYNKVVLKWSFVLATLLMPLLAAGFTAVPLLLFSLKGEPTRIAVVDPAGQILPRLQKNLSADRMVEKAKKAARDSMTEIDASQEERMRTVPLSSFRTLFLSDTTRREEPRRMRAELVARIIAGEIDAFVSS